jgi:hypothetical protein
MIDESKYTVDEQADEYRGPDDAVFIVETACTNCGATDSWGFQDRTTVVDKPDGVRVNACGALGCKDDCGRCGRLRCSVCDMVEHLETTDRRPID